MQTITKQQMDTLVKLQSIEIETSIVNTILSDVPERLESLDAQMQTFKKSLADEESRFDTFGKKYRSQEADLEVNLSRIKKSEEKLRAVKTNKEYQSILKEIDDMKTINSSIEDEMLECLDQIEESERLLAQKKVEFEKLRERIGNEKETIEQESETEKKKLSNLEAEWKRVSAEIEPDLMKIYVAIRDSKGTAVAGVNAAVCYGCHLNIPPQMFNELQRCDSLTFCPHCQRIIYWMASTDEKQQISPERSGT
jgi:predicted  nucleic acid-binding Zn-ribbon protein